MSGIVIHIADDVVERLALTDGAPAGVASYVELAVVHAIARTLGDDAAHFGKVSVTFWQPPEQTHPSRWVRWGTDADGVYGLLEEDRDGTIVGVAEPRVVQGVDGPTVRTTPTHPEDLAELAAAGDPLSQAKLGDAVENAMRGPEFTDEELRRLGIEDAGAGGYA
jgi:hypothetical protein